jgi:hypothetical protein
MTVLVDTSVWSLALRRKTESLATNEKNVNELSELIREGRAKLIGLVRQELLSGIEAAEQYETLNFTFDSFRTKSQILFSLLLLCYCELLPQRWGTERWDTAGAVPHRDGQTNACAG